MTDELEPTVTERAEAWKMTDEEHPAFGMISASRWHGGDNRLFDSDIIHNDIIVITISEATRHRSSGSHDYIHPTNTIAEVKMSMAQWASFVSSMNTTGVPCTIRHRQTGPLVKAPDIVEEPRLAMTMCETRNAANRAFADIEEALAEFERLHAEGGGKRARDAALHTLRARVDNAPKNVTYAGEVLAEHAENVVQKARADIETMVARHHQRLAELGAGDAHWSIPELPVGEVVEIEDGDAES